MSTYKELEHREKNCMESEKQTLLKIKLLLIGIIIIITTETFVVKVLFIRDN